MMNVGRILKGRMLEGTFLRNVLMIILQGRINKQIDLKTVYNYFHFWDITWSRRLTTIPFQVKSQHGARIYLCSYTMSMTFFLAFLGALLIQAQDQSGLLKTKMNLHYISFFFKVVCTPKASIKYHSLKKNCHHKFINFWQRKQT